MWPVAAGAAAVVLAAMLAAAIVSARRSSRERLLRLHGILASHGDDQPRPRSTDAAIERLDQLVGTPSKPARQGASHEQLSAALDEVPIGVVVSDQSGSIVLRNRVAQPYERGRHSQALVEASIQTRLAEAMRGHPSDEELRLLGPPERVYLVVATPLEDDGNVVGAVVLVDDVSEQHRVDAVRRDFVANVSHELRTPVGAISLLAETLEDEADAEVRERFTTRIQNETRRLARLIDDLLDLSRIEGGAGGASEPVVLASVISESVAAVREAAEHKSIELRVEHAAESAGVVGDHGHLVSAVTNLLENAVKYTPDGGQVECRVERHGDELTLAVTDTGIGIPRKDLSRIFERFYRVDRGRSSKSGGTGLGLSIARHAAVEHGGRIEVDSQEGVGSTFTMVLPVESTGEASAAEAIR